MISGGMRHGGSGAVALGLIYHYFLLKMLSGWWDEAEWEWGCIALGLMHKKNISKISVLGISFEHTFHDQGVDQ
jgi:hypothetical protein